MLLYPILNPPLKSCSFLSIICVGNLSPAMMARNQVGIGLSYQPVSLCSFATQFQTRFLDSIPCPKAGLKFSALFNSVPPFIIHPVPEIIDPVFAKTSQNARFLLSENERFGLVFVKTGSINSGTGGYCTFYKYVNHVFFYVVPSSFFTQFSCNLDIYLSIKTVIRTYYHDYTL
jgi:hypothetical protein